MIAAALCLALAAQGPELQLPASPAGRAWAGRVPSSAPIDVPPENALFANPASWDSRETWKHWSALVEHARKDEVLRPQISASLALAALGHGRDEDAWEHFAGLGPSSEWMSALVPHFVLGSASATLADGARIAPALPPLPRPVRERQLGLVRMERREMKLSGVVLGPARIEVRVAVEYDGVQVDLVHLGGGEARALVALPDPLDFEVTTVYVDWERAADPKGPHEVVLSEAKPKVEIYGRCRSARVRWPLAADAELDVRARTHGFELLVPPKDTTSPRALGFAEALAALAGVPARVRAFEPARNDPPWPGIAIDLATEPNRARKERTLLSAMERFALSR